jgi:hypothetical protein
VTERNRHAEQAIQRTKHPLSNIRSFAVVDFELSKRPTEVIAEKHMEKRSHGSFAMTASTGW